MLVDASYGFEMETFEFLNICQVHGMPRIMGILNHLDQLDGISQVFFKNIFYLKNFFPGQQNQEDSEAPLLDRVVSGKH